MKEGDSNGKKKKKKKKEKKDLEADKVMEKLTFCHTKQNFFQKLKQNLTHFICLDTLALA